MKRHPRPPYILKTVKWGGPILLMLLVAVWLGLPRGFRRVHVFPNGGFVALSSAGPSFGWRRDLKGASTSAVQKATGEFFHYGTGVGWFPGNGPDPVSWSVVFPLGFAIFGIVIGIVIAWTLDASKRGPAEPNLCQRCRYDRSGLAAGAVCPECGAAPPAPGGAAER